MNVQLFSEIVLLMIPRILGFIDRDPRSPTFGCGDRNFWHYKLQDLPNLRFQEACLILALLYENPFPGNCYFQNENVLSWILGISHFWVKNQNNDGSFSEVYPFERSLCATSFSTAAITATWRLIKDKVKKFPGSTAFEKELLHALPKTGNWLVKNFSLEVGNQAVACVGSLMNLALILENPSLKAEAKTFFESVYDSWKRNNFIPEYGGFDVGYSTISNSYLRRIQKCYPEKSKEIEEILEMVNNRIELWVDEDGNYDGHPTSRNTQFLFPFGMVNSVKLISRLLNGLRKNVTISPLWLDDRYCVGLTLDYLEAFLSFQKKAEK